MPLDKTYIPYGAYWSSPFCRWQGSLADAHSIELLANTAKRALEARSIPATRYDALVLGTSVPQKHGFYGAPWVAGLIGAADITGPMIGQACATSARVLVSAAQEVELGQRRCVLALTCDRTSNGPHIYYPDPSRPGGRGVTEDPVWDNFGHDPWAGQAMIATAENVAREIGASREELDQVTLRRDAQYREALADDRAFQKRYMVAVEVGKKKTRLVEADEGVMETSAEGLAKLRPVLPGGTCTFGSQTYPADGNAGITICDADTAAELSRDKKITVQVLGYGEARVKKGYMPMATVPAARKALQHAGVELSDCQVIKTHNPFAVNDLYFARETGADLNALNPYGSPLIYGHPQAPTGTRVMIEMIEALALRGGGTGLFTGCAAGDTAMAVVLRVS